jgi:ribosomal protein S4
LRDVLERRLQTQVYKKNLANSVQQARQFITHEHICIGSRVVTSPSYLVPLSEETQIKFRLSSSISDPEHPERVATRKAKEKQEKEMIVVKEEEPVKPAKGKPGKADRKRPAPRKPASKPTRRPHKSKDKPAEKSEK